MTSNYENAPSTEMLNTNCACCGRKLRDAVSVEVGIGPVCRDKFAADVDFDGASWKAANVAIHAAAKKVADADAVAVAAIVAQLQGLGFFAVAAKIEARFEKTLAKAAKSATVKIEALDSDPGGFAVSTPFKPEFVADLKNAVEYTQRRWNAAAKRWEVSPSAKAALWNVVKAHFAGATGCGPKGIFVIPA